MFLIGSSSVLLVSTSQTQNGQTQIILFFEKMEQYLKFLVHVERKSHSKETVPFYDSKYMAHLHFCQNL